jgi:hypothetical protein
MTDAIAGAQSAPGSITSETITAGVRDEEALLRLYVGKNAAKFARIYRSKMESKRRWKWGLVSFNWSAAIFGLPWFLYRKLYIEGAAILLPIVLIYLIPSLDKLNLAIGGVIGAVANLYYVEQAIKKIRKVEAQPLPQDERDALIQASGGTSTAGAILGSIVFLSLFGLAVLPLLAK